MIKLKSIVLFLKILACFIAHRNFANQLDFKPGDTCINQLLSITHQIYQSFDDGYEVRSLFLEMSKAFNKLCHRVKGK